MHQPLSKGMGMDDMTHTDHFGQKEKMKALATLDSNQKR